MNIISISHKTAPVNIRELFALSKEEQETFLQSALMNSHIDECVIVSTCNRTEVYFNGDNQAIQVIQQMLADLKNMELELLISNFNVYTGEKSIQHLFRVTCGMDSMVMGEDEILGQVKAAYERALHLRITKYELNTLFQAAITCAKRIKTDTKISKIPISMGTLVAHEIFHFPKVVKKVLIIGISGKMGTIIMKNLNGKQNIEIIGTTRSHNLIERYNIAYQNVKMIEYKNRYPYINDADIIISVTTSPHYTITYYELMQNITTEKERLFIDLSVPMDIDKNILKINKTRIYDVDYFDEASKNNTLIKEQEALGAQILIDEHVNEVKKELSFHDFIAVIPKINLVMKERTFEKILYDIKENANPEELDVVLNVFRKLAK